MKDHRPPPLTSHSVTSIPTPAKLSPTTTATLLYIFHAMPRIGARDSQSGLLSFTANDAVSTTRVMQRLLRLWGMAARLARGE
jgi:hypothetical protein